MKNLFLSQKGFLLPVAIFVLVILAGLVAYGMRLALLMNQGTIQDIQGSRAYLAARAGVEWAAYQVLMPGSTTMQSCPSVPSPFTINGFTVTLTCSQTNGTDKGGTQSIGIYTITSKASMGTSGQQDYVERMIQVSLSRCLFGTLACS